MSSMRKFWRCCKSACSTKEDSSADAGSAATTGSRKAAASRSKAIDLQLRQERRKRRSEVRLLLLGAGESGKSTFVKQMRIINDVAFTEAELDEYRKLIHVSIVRGLQVLLQAKKKLGVPFQTEGLEPQADMALAFNSYHSINRSNMADIAVLCQLLWSDPALKEVFRRRAEFQVMDSIGYFLDNLDRIKAGDYVPSNQDILYARRTTREISEFRIRMQEVDFVFLDVGGQRTQREKWFDLFSQEITATLFMASASEFDQRLREDARENRLKESMIIFRTLVNNSGFRETPFILFLNKMDLLEEKVWAGAAGTAGTSATAETSTGKQGTISDYFDEFNEDDSAVIAKYSQGRKFGRDPVNLEDVKTFILSMFLRNVNDRKSAGTSFRKAVYHHFTIATDTDNIRLVFQSVRDSILRKNLDALMLE